MVVNSRKQPIFLVQQSKFMDAATQFANPLEGIARSFPLFSIAAVAPNAERRGRLEDLACCRIARILNASGDHRNGCTCFLKRLERPGKVFLHSFWKHMAPRANSEVRAGEAQRSCAFCETVVVLDPAEVF